MLFKVEYYNVQGECLYRHIVAKTPKNVFDFWEKKMNARLKSVEILDRYLEMVQDDE